VGVGRTWWGVGKVRRHGFRYPRVYTTLQLSRMKPQPDDGSNTRRAPQTITKYWLILIK
jgi:hypothetical protein